MAAARLAVWHSREYRDGRGNTAAANGWFRRAARLLERLPDSPARGWLALLEAERAADPDEAVGRAGEALSIARAWQDIDGELRARARLGLWQTRRGRVGSGMGELDEAKAAATSETMHDWETFGYVCCALVSACEVTGDAARMGQWSEVITDFLDAHAHVPLLAFCASCCGEMFLASGAVEPAETELARALTLLEDAGQTARCVHPAARLAHLRGLQGRLEDAERLLAGYEGLPEAVAPAELPAAQQAAKQLAEIARASAVRWVEADAMVATSRVAAACGDVGALDLLEQALTRFGELGMPLWEARVRLDIARLVAEERPALATTEARAALASFERLGASHEADAASALLRELGPAGRAGPKGYGTLTSARPRSSVSSPTG